MIFAVATYKKLITGRWQAQVSKQGIRRAKSFRSKQEARDWANRQEFLISEGDGSAASGTLRDIFQRYAREVSPKKRGARWEQIRLERLCGDSLADVPLKQLAASDFAQWRDERLLQVKPATVNREMVLMSGALNVARKEWGVISVNPLSDVRKPSKPPPRDRRVSQEEIDALLKVSGSDLNKVTARAIHAFRFAIETGMRAGEIVGLEWERVDLDKRVARLELTKNGTTREVPLSSKAVELLLETKIHEVSCFGINSAQLDALFRKARDTAKIPNLRFHDSRHEAITRLAKKLDVLSLARMVGHKDIRMLQIYYTRQLKS